MTLAYLDVLTAIEAGNLDKQLAILAMDIESRRSQLSARLLSTVKPGDEVRFSDGIRPKYLVGRTATVVKRNQKSVVVNCPDEAAYRRYRNAKNVRCPNSLIAGLAE